MSFTLDDLTPDFLRSLDTPSDLAYAVELLEDQGFDQLLRIARDRLHQVRDKLVQNKVEDVESVRESIAKWAEVQEEASLTSTKSKKKQQQKQKKKKAATTSLPPVRGSGSGAGVESAERAPLSPSSLARVAENERMKGNDYFRAKEFERAVERYTKSLEASKTGVVLSNRAAAFLRLNLFEKAVEDATEAIECGNETFKPYWVRGCARMEMYRFEESGSDLERASQLCSSARMKERIAAAQAKLAERTKDIKQKEADGFVRLQITTVEEDSDSDSSSDSEGESVPINAAPKEPSERPSPPADPLAEAKKLKAAAGAKFKQFPGQALELYRKALHLITPLISREDHDSLLFGATIMSNCAACYARLDDHGQVERNAKYALTLFNTFRPRNEEERGNAARIRLKAAVRLCKAMGEQSKFKEALDVLAQEERKGGKASPSSVLGRLRAELISKAVARSKQRATVLAASGDQLAQKQEYESAAECYARALRFCFPSGAENPLSTSTKRVQDELLYDDVSHQVAVLASRAKCLLEMGELSKAEQDSSLAMRLDPDSAVARDAHAAVQKRLGVGADLEDAAPDNTAPVTLLIDEVEGSSGDDDSDASSDDDAAAAPATTPSPLVEPIQTGQVDHTKGRDRVAASELAQLESEIPPPTSFIDFRTAWKQLKARPASFASYLRQLEPQDLLVLFRLEGSIDADFIETMLVAFEALVADHAEWTLEMLEQLPQTYSFSTNVHMIFGEPKAALERTCVALEALSEEYASRVALVRKNFIV